MGNVSGFYCVVTQYNGQCIGILFFWFPSSSFARLEAGAWERVQEKHSPRRHEGHEEKQKQLMSTRKAFTTKTRRTRRKAKTVNEYKKSIHHEDTKDTKKSKNS